MYEASEESTRQIRYALLRQMPLNQLESLARTKDNKKQDDLARLVLKDSYESVFNSSAKTQLNAKAGDKK
jgi:hypothetical protein